jgi:DNA-binding PadR family transcriptional regulator
MVGEKIVPRGFLKSYILKLLRSGHKHGYAIIKAIENETGWKPSPGGIYSTLHELEKKGFIIKLKEGRRKYYKLTRDGEEFIKKFDKSLNEMKDRFRDFVGVMSQILDVKEPELRRMIDSHIKSQRSLIFMLPPSLKKSLQKSRILIFKTAKNKTKHKKLEKILKETIKKLERVVGE